MLKKLGNLIVFGYRDWGSRCQNNRGRERWSQDKMYLDILPSSYHHNPHMFRSSDHDPLAAAIAPPKNESPAARAVRLRAEAEARRVSDEIDEQLKQDRVARRRQRPCVKVLLLGQSESGVFPASTLRPRSFVITSCFRP